MNRVLMKEVIEDVRNSETFNMRFVFDNNGCPSCIVGHVLTRFSMSSGVPYDDRGVRDSTMMAVAADLLQLDIGQRDLLFAPGLSHESYRIWSRPGEGGHITKEHAVRCMEHLLETGEVDWVVTDPNRKGSSRE